MSQTAKKRSSRNNVRNLREEILMSKAELARAGASLQRLGLAEREVIEKITKAIVAKVAHEPIAALKDGVLDAETMKRIFGITDVAEVPLPLEEPFDDEDDDAKKRGSSG